MLLSVLVFVPSVGEPFLALTPAIMAMDDNLPMARTACPVFYEEEERFATQIQRQMQRLRLGDIGLTTSGKHIKTSIWKYLGLKTGNKWENEGLS